MPGLFRPGRSLALLCLILAASAIGSAAALAGASFGFRAGWSNLDGGVFRGSEDVGGVGLIGLQANLPLTPLLTLNLAGETRNQEVKFSDKPWDDDREVWGKGDWKEMALFASLRLRILPLGIGPAGIYGGGGIGVHFTEVDLDDGSIGMDGDESVDDILDRIEDEESEVSYHFVLGASMGIPILPVSVFAETRFEDVGGDYSPKGYSIYGGVNLDLP